MMLFLKSFQGFKCNCDPIPTQFPMKPDMLNYIWSIKEPRITTHSWRTDQGKRTFHQDIKVTRPQCWRAWVIVQGQKNRWMEQNWEPRNRPTHICKLKVTSKVNGKGHSQKWCWDNWNKNKTKKLDTWQHAWKLNSKWWSSFEYEK